MHKDVHAASLLGRSTERSTDWSQSTLGLARSTGRSTDQRAVALWFWARSTGRPNGQKFDRWSVDRLVDRKVIFDLSASQRADFVMGYLYPIWEMFLHKFLEQKFPTFSRVLLQVLKSFIALKIWSLFCFKGLEKSKKNIDLGYLLCSSFLSNTKLFFQVFFFVLLFPNSLFSTLELIYYPIYRIFVFVGKEVVCGLYDHQVVNPPSLWYLSCVEVDYWGGGFVPYPSSERLIGCLALCPSLKCEVIVFEWLCA